MDFLSAGNRLVLKTPIGKEENYLLYQFQKHRCKQCQMLNRNIVGNVTLSLPDHKCHQLPKVHRPLVHLARQQSVEETENKRLLKITSYLMSSA